ncbi:hypothetical protein LWI29_010316 [Acer saccharum]|uniref:Uncharacterized protein n=1 Tax=Acer saccharum TaxID=4024 RepID=A0AA39S6L8_ACESA|nr:hypothetical protein LWI29_010316 [Acer saccharum]
MAGGESDFLDKGKESWFKKSRPRPAQPTCNVGVKIRKKRSFGSKMGGFDLESDSSESKSDIRFNSNFRLIQDNCSKVGQGRSKSVSGLKGSLDVRPEVGGLLIGKQGLSGKQMDQAHFRGTYSSGSEVSNSIEGEVPLSPKNRSSNGEQSSSDGVFLLVVFLLTSIKLPLTAHPVTVRAGRRRFSRPLAFTLLASIFLSPPFFWIAYFIIIITSPCHGMLWNLQKCIFKWLCQTLQSIPTLVISCTSQQQDDDDPEAATHRLTAVDQFVDMNHDQGNTMQINQSRLEQDSVVVIDN